MGGLDPRIGVQNPNVEEPPGLLHGKPVKDQDIEGTNESVIIESIEVPLLPGQTNHIDTFLALVRPLLIDQYARGYNDGLKDGAVK